MQKAIGLILLGSGLVYAAYSNSTSSLDREEQIAAVTRIVAQGVIIEPATVAAEQPGLRQPVTPSASAVSAFAAPELATAAVPRPETVVGPPLTVDPPTGAWETRLDPVSIPAREVVPASPAAVQKTQRQLARQIQSELTRVGCYTGRLDGSWGDQSRAAMTAFIARVNASLPTREPDVILLSLIKGQTGEVCGVACRPGDVAAAGRCAPRTVLAAADAIPAAAPIEAVMRRCSRALISMQVTSTPIATMRIWLPGGRSVSVAPCGKPSHASGAARQHHWTIYVGSWRGAAIPDRFMRKP